MTTERAGGCGPGRRAGAGIPRGARSRRRAPSESDVARRPLPSSPTGTGEPDLGDSQGHPPHPAAPTAGCGQHQRPRGAGPCRPSDAPWLPSPAWGQSGPRGQSPRLGRSPASRMLPPWSPSRGASGPACVGPCPGRGPHPVQSWQHRPALLPGRGGHQRAAALRRGPGLRPRQAGASAEARPQARWS
jgi:hypothetical protein